MSDQAVALWERKGRLPKTADRLLRLIYVEHDRGNAPIRSTIQRINDMDAQDRAQYQDVPTTPPSQAIV